MPHRIDSYLIIARIERMCSVEMKLNQSSRLQQNTKYKIQQIQMLNTLGSVAPRSVNVNHDVSRSCDTFRPIAMLETGVVNRLLNLTALDATGPK